MSENQGKIEKQVQRAAVFQLPRNEQQNRCMAWHSSKWGIKPLWIVLHGIICRRKSHAFTVPTVGSLWIYMCWEWVLFVCYSLPQTFITFKLGSGNWLENRWVYKNTPYILNVSLLVFNLHGLFLLCKGRVCEEKSHPLSRWDDAGNPGKCWTVGQQREILAGKCQTWTKIQDVKN